MGYQYGSLRLEDEQQPAEELTPKESPSDWQNVECCQ